MRLPLLAALLAAAGLAAFGLVILTQGMLFAGM